MSTFKLNSGDTEFKDRQKKIFDQLQVLENNRKNTVANEPESRESRTHRRVHRSDTKHFKGKESIFKKPQNPAPKNYINKIPDFKKNPHKWTKYSLEDVQEVTEESNAKSAMDFLKELADRRKLEAGIVKEDLEELPSKIVFNKHVRTTAIRESREHNPDDLADNNDKEEPATFSNSKLVMPEYVIGQRPVKKDRHSKKTKPDKGKELKLDHLVFEDD